ncbi:MAG: hypothetical protein WD669_10255 [Pirellulales bacterium]
MRFHSFISGRLFPCIVAAASWLVSLGGGGFCCASEHASHDNHVPAADASGSGESESGIHGVSLGEFSIRAYYPVEAKRSTVTFTLFAIVSSDHAGEFEQLIENRRHKVRDQVIIATRLVPLADFDDPQLKEFRRRILLRLRRTLPELAIDDIYVSDFQIEVRDI